MSHFCQIEKYKCDKASSFFFPRKYENIPGRKHFYFLDQKKKRKEKHTHPRIKKEINMKRTMHLYSLLKFCFATSKFLNNVFSSEYVLASVSKIKHTKESRNIFC